MFQMLQSIELRIVLGCVCFGWLAWKCATPFMVARDVRRGMTPPAQAVRSLIQQAIVILAPCIAIISLVQYLNPWALVLAGVLFLIGGFSLWMALRIRQRSKMPGAGTNANPPAGITGL